MSRHLMSLHSGHVMHFLFFLICVTSAPLLRTRAGAGVIACAETTEAKNIAAVAIATRFIVKLRFVDLLFQEANIPEKFWFHSVARLGRRADRSPLGRRPGVDTQAQRASVFERLLRRQKASGGAQNK